MGDLRLRTRVLGGAPLAVALIRRALGWALGALGAGMMARRPAAGERPVRDSRLRWAQA